MKRSGSIRVSRSKVRGAAMVEYAVLCVAVCIAAAFAAKGVGKEVTRGMTEASTVVKAGNQ